MKALKAVAVFVSLCMIFAFASCGKPQKEGSTSPAAPTKNEITQASVTSGEVEIEYLAVYCPYDEGSVKTAKLIAERTGATLFALETVNGYSDEKETRELQIKNEKENNMRPAIKNRIQSFFSYSVLFFCTPLWENDLPMSFYTFFDDYDLRDRVIMPVCSTDNESDREKCYSLLKDALGETVILLDGVAVPANGEADADKLAEYIDKALND